jgi:hypothetical protein
MIFSSILKVGMASSSRMLVPFEQIMWPYITQDYNLNNLKIWGFQSNENLDSDWGYDIVVLYMVTNAPEDSGSIIYSKDYNLRNNPYMWLF